MPDAVGLRLTGSLPHGTRYTELCTMALEHEHATYQRFMADRDAASAHAGHFVLVMGDDIMGVDTLYGANRARVACRRTPRHWRAPLAHAHVRAISLTLELVETGQIF